MDIIADNDRSICIATEPKKINSMCSILYKTAILQNLLSLTNFCSQFFSGCQGLRHPDFLDYAKTAKSTWKKQMYQNDSQNTSQCITMLLACCNTALERVSIAFQSFFLTKHFAITCSDMDYGVSACSRRTSSLYREATCPNFDV